MYIYIFFYCISVTLLNRYYKKLHWYLIKELNYKLIICTRENIFI